jgi:hypothetical protein
MIARVLNLRSGLVGTAEQGHGAGCRVRESRRGFAVVAVQPSARGDGGFRAAGDTGSLSSRVPLPYPISLHPTLCSSEAP